MLWRFVEFRENLNDDENKKKSHGHLLREDDDGGMYFTVMIKYSRTVIKLHLSRTQPTHLITHQVDANIYLTLQEEEIWQTPRRRWRQQPWWVENDDWGMLWPGAFTIILQTEKVKIFQDVFKCHKYFIFNNKNKIKFEIMKLGFRKWKRIVSAIEYKRQTMKFCVQK